MPTFPPSTTWRARSPGKRFPKDLQTFVHLAGTVGVDFEILQAAERVNKQRIDRFLEKVIQALCVVKGKRVAVLG
jgi:UDPglucose 6-dehydrogenase